MSLQTKSRTYSFDTFRWELVRDQPLFARVAQVRQPTDAARLAYDVIGTRDREHFIAILLNTRNRVITIDTVSIGSLNGSLVHPREVYRLAIVKGAAGIITSHNHPSGDPTPSREDLELVRRLTAAGKVIGIAQLDHVIVTPDLGAWTSFKEKGLL
jgi:DNA repair protein RadC